MAAALPSPTRRHLLVGGGAATASAALALAPLSTEAARREVGEAAKDGVFAFGVASGDPTATEVLLWTRVTPDPSAVPGSGRGRSTTVLWEVATDDEEQDDPDTSYTGAGEPAGVRAEGDFLARRALAYQAYLEWMPIREPATWQPEPHAGTQFFRRFSFGDLAELSVIETRQNRSRQEPTRAGAALNPALADPARHLPEPEQLAWLAAGLTAGRTAWHLVGNQTVFARVFTLPGAGVLPGQVFSTDQWDGYQADQAGLLAAMAASGGTDPVVLTGDIHSSWANDLPVDPVAYGADRSTSVGVEFVCPSVTSDGFKEVLGGSAATAAAVTAAFQAVNPWVVHLEGIGHGFAVVDVTPDRVQTDFWYIRSGGDKGLLVDPRLDPAATVAWESSWQTLKGSRVVSGPVEQLGPRADGPRSLLG